MAIYLWCNVSFDGQSIVHYKPNEREKRRYKYLNLKELSSKIVVNLYCYFFCFFLIDFFTYHYSNTFPFFFANDKWLAGYKCRFLLTICSMDVPLEIIRTMTVASRGRCRVPAWQQKKMRKIMEKRKKFEKKEMIEKRGSNREKREKSGKR